MSSLRISSVISSNIVAAKFFSSIIIDSSCFNMVAHVVGFSDTVARNLVSSS